MTYIHTYIHTYREIVYRRHYDRARYARPNNYEFNVFVMSPYENTCGMYFLSSCLEKLEVLGQTDLQGYFAVRVDSRAWLDS